MHAEATNMVPIYDVYSAIVYAMNSKNVRSSMVEGEWIMRDRVVLHVNKEEAVEGVNRIAAEIRMKNSDKR